ncbi:hypothetical protein MMC09_004373 [Bachmanniomyces sp. S44760]|nr:hypothetical protein [Bachmanniomyces sp. S44760]
MEDEKKSYSFAEIISETSSAISTPEKPRLTAGLHAALPIRATLCPAISNDEESETHNNNHHGTMNPCSPFYSHPTTRTSFEQAKSESKVNLKHYPDLESGRTSHENGGMDSHIIVSSKPCRVWPGMQSQTQLCKKSASPWKNLSMKQRLWIKVLIALIIVGAAVGIGVGVSKATGAGVWKNDNSQTPIGNGSGS